MITKEFFNSNFPIWLEIEQRHPNNSLYMYIKSARKPTKAEQRTSGHTDLAAIINSPFFMEEIYGDEVLSFSIEENNEKENRILKESDIADAVKRKVLPKKFRELAIKYIFNEKKYSGWAL